MYKFKTVLAFTEVFCGVADKIEKQSFEKKGPLENGLFFYVFLTLLTVICPETRTGYSLFIWGKQLA
jgi:hypothetical protein